MNQRSFKAPVFFTSASRVKIPFVGDDTTKIKPIKGGLYPVTNPLQRHHNKIANHFVKSVSGDITFDIDVVKDRSAHLVPFENIDFEVNMLIHCTLLKLQVSISLYFRVYMIRQ